MGHIDLAVQEILDTINELLEIDNKDQSYINVVKRVLEKIYNISVENKIEDIAFELSEIERLLKEDDKEQGQKYIEKLENIKKILEDKISQRSKILIFHDSDNLLDELINKINKNNIDVVLLKSDAVDSIFSHNPNAVVIQNNKDMNAVTILKCIREEKVLDQFPIIVISDADYNNKIECLKLGVIDYIEHNFDVEEVYLKLINIVNMSCKCLKNTVYDISTGLYTRKQGELLAQSLLVKAKDEKKQATLLVIDFDYMSEINKNFGVSFGNKIINKVVSEFKKYTTKVDIVYRMSGDKFAFVFYDKDVKWVKNIADKVLRFAINHGEEMGKKISFSGGISSSLKDKSDYKDMMLRAKEALSIAKMEGRSRIVIDIDFVKQNKIVNILFVDDDKIIVSILKSRYKNKGYNVFTASDGLEALEILKNYDIGLVVTDYYLKLMNGDELIKNIRQTDKETPIIVLSSQKNEDYIKRTLELGADDYILKPFSPVELDSRIKKLLD
ncbi:diguanylate cyclase (GGDEF) domain-containing protein [Alkalithermobacter thermoalcaliphilus JW-YL-7 = DSM 7308]|uniref:Stage 0 sporulation protein A homolog n=1 Tax=Alkalithermobacter thermoalcaliphilus JW-YL-7 = DSM 7308 TaxID=1121328 RepID=A0A150FNT5_CLOPD|nr:response regulator receiver protein [[Clostridium] paradoxum JW-YL-7 = DSM 7308]SHK87010.1 diguanylate cyclase (GGDEF) domain-containing protein [[Clostridium] paradoxum JW-YL-7 = DSM 7308]